MTTAQINASVKHFCQHYGINHAVVSYIRNGNIYPISSDKIYLNTFNSKYIL